MPYRVKCPTGKRVYLSEAKADSELNIVGPQYGDFTMRSYPCNRCGYWHHGHKKPSDRPLPPPSPKELLRRFHSLGQSSSPEGLAERRRIVGALRAQGLPDPTFKKLKP